MCIKNVHRIQPSALAAGSTSAARVRDIDWLCASETAASADG